MERRRRGLYRARICKFCESEASGGENGNGFKRTGVIAADVEVVFVGVAVIQDDGLEVVAAWWGECCVGGGVCVEGEGEGEG